MRSCFAVVVLSLVTVAASAKTAPPVFVRDAVGLRMTAAAPHVADRDGMEPMTTLASAVDMMPEAIDGIRRWNTRGDVPPKNGFTRMLGETLRVRVGGTEAMASPGVGVITRSARGNDIWSGSIHVRDAFRLRLHLKNVVVPQGTTFWVYGRGEDAIGFGTELIDDRGELYTPTISGDTVYLELELPSPQARASFDIADVLEIVNLGVLGGGITPNDVPSCLIDATCVTSSSLDVIDLYRKAVAHLQYVKDGDGFVCSGGLLNDSEDSSFIPYLLTANHCFSSQASATSLEAYWDYVTSTCNGSFPSINSKPRSNGSTLLATSTATDFTFVRLNSVPSGRVFLGWDTNPPANGTKLHRLSHPFPDSFTQPAPQRYSTTLVTTTSPTCTARPRGPYLYSTLDSGGTYGGSSGAPVILAGGFVVGQLLGACGPEPTSGCLNTNMNVDGAFRMTYDSVQNFLSDVTTPTCAANSTTACMLNGRFRVRVRFRAGFDNAPVDNDALLKPVTGFSNPNFETAFFYFNSPDNIEMLVKILDQGNTNPQGQPTIAVLFGSATPLRIEVTITDTLRGPTKVYTSEFGAMRGATDFEAFVK